MNQSHIKILATSRSWLHQEEAHQHIDGKRYIAYAVVCPYTGEQGYTFFDIPQPKSILDINHATRDGVFNLMHQCRKRIWF
jgi:hypothetical protein